MSKENMSIEVANTEEMVSVVANLVKEGVTFQVTKVYNTWIIVLTGGY